MNRTKGKISSRIWMILISAYLILPLVMTFLYSIFSEWNHVLPSGLTLESYGQIFADGNFWLSIGRTLIVSVAPVLICTFIMLLVMYVVVVHLPWLDKYIQILCTIPYAVQGIILAVGVLSLYANAPDPLSNRVILLTATYCIVVLPYVYQGIKNALYGANAVRMIEAAQMLGASRIHSYFRVVVPNILSGVTVSAMLATAVIFGDFVIINTLGGGHFPTAQMYLYDVLKKSGQRSSAVIVILFLVILLISAAVFWSSRKKKTREES